MAEKRKGKKDRASRSRVRHGANGQDDAGGKPHKDGSQAVNSGPGEEQAAPNVGRSDVQVVGGACCFSRQRGS